MSSLTKILNLLTSFASILVLTTIDYASIGCSLFDVPGVKKDILIFFSSSVFVFTAFVAQLVFGLVSKIETGFVATIIFEGCIFSRKIAEVCYDQLSSSNSKEIVLADLYMNIFICMAISTFLFSVFSLLPYIYKAGDFLRDLPLTAVFVTMITVGVSLLKDSVGKYIANIISSDGSSTKDIVLLTVSIISAFLIFFIEKLAPSFSFLIPAATLAIVAVYNLVAKFVLKYTIEEVKRDGLVLDFGSASEMKLWHVLGLFNGGKIVLSCILKNIGNIVTLTLFNLIHININLFPYQLVTGTEINISAEWRTQSIANMFNVFTGFPSYFVSSSSIFFYKSGGKSRLSTIIGSLAPITVGLCIPYISNYIPNILSSIIICYIGILFVHSYFISILSYVSKFDLMVILFSVVLSQLLNILTGIVLSIAIVTIYIIKQYYLEVLQRDSRPDIQATSSLLDDESSSKVIKVEYIICFMTINKLKNDLKNVKKEVTLDLSRCPYIDMNGNMFLYDFADTVERIRIIGRPMNFYETLFSRKNNIHLSGKAY